MVLVGYESEEVKEVASRITPNSLGFTVVVAVR
jgi:hypothetical protein